jgi:hypothetical protein
VLWSSWESLRALVGHRLAQAPQSVQASLTDRWKRGSLVGGVRGSTAKRAASLGSSKGAPFQSPRGGPKLSSTSFESSKCVLAATQRLHFSLSAQWKEAESPLSLA